MEKDVYEKLVNHPAHYVGQSALAEPIDLCERLGFNVGNALKYVIRAGHKGDGVVDLEKARWYLLRAEDPGHIFAPKDAEYDGVATYLLSLYSKKVGMPAMAKLLDSNAGYFYERVGAFRKAVEDRLNAVQGI